jgi:hypothetical protein
MHTTRRAFLAGTAGAVLGAAKAPLLTAEQDRFLDDLSRRTFRYFEEYTDRDTGMARGRCHADGTPYDPNRADIGSIAVTGFGLTGFCIAAERKWITHERARVQVRNAMRFFLDHAPREHGWFYHWMNVKTGERTGVLQDSKQKSELSSIDTALLMGGILTAKQYFAKDREIQRLATALYERIDFAWMLNGDKLLLSHGWRPESGFISSRWNHYSEHTVLNLMAIGSPSHPIPMDAWYAWERNENKYHDEKFIGTSPLFTHQYSHAFVDYRGRRENRVTNVDWFGNSVTATRVHRQFCMDLAKEFPGYTDTIWGITSSNSVKGYRAWGGPPRNRAIDGTVVPCAAGGSLMLTPDIAVPAMMAMRDQYGDKIYGRYGFTDAFHPTAGWASADVLGLDTGITLLSAENLRSGNVWKWFMGNREIVKAMAAAGLVRS